MSAHKPKFPCPQCGQPTIYDPEHELRPFCSERCRLLDLGNWLDERYRVVEPSDGGAEPVAWADDVGSSGGDEA